MKTCLVGVVLLVAGALHADEAVYLMRGPVLPGARSINGYVVDVRPRGDNGVEVRVETSLDPIGSRGAFAGVMAGDRPRVPDDFTLPSRLRAELRADLPAWEAATLVLEWVWGNLKLIDDDHHPQDAASVLYRGGGRCSGLANATAALLMTAGFESRTVSGLLITDRRAIPHRWVECRLPAAGWVPTDPTLGLWIITAGHIAFSDAVGHLPEIDVITPPRGELHRLPRKGTTMMRPNDGAELLCRLGRPADGRTAVASLQRGSDRRQAVLGPEVRFADLLPGRWLLIVEVDGRVVEKRELNLKEGAVHSYVVNVPLDPSQEVGS